MARPRIKVTLGAVLLVFVGLPLLMAAAFLARLFIGVKVETAKGENFVGRVERNDFERSWEKLEVELKWMGFDVDEDRGNMDWIGEAKLDDEWSGIDVKGTELEFDHVFRASMGQNLLFGGKTQRLTIFVKDGEVVDIWSMNRFR